MTHIARIAIVLLIATAASAQEPEDGVVTEGGLSYQRKTVINFEDDTIEGNLKVPDGAYVQGAKKVRHRSLIRIRTDFRREVLSSVADL